ncbi:hypothetical protein KY285_024973 [Solanum tuberosum]|nr:hypothetical protein KY289_025139 [Solanum tuberosum]KAH0673855.1 hypothetical protein KY284_024942 [Solanum tuberosum]KAH0677172.1 hypothetical protein KY285_024973 [Solanum tuberosum]
MMAFILITLRWYHGRLTEFDPPPKYIGGQVTEFLDVDVDRMSYFELRNYIKELGYIIDFCPQREWQWVGEESFNEVSNPNNQPPTSTFPSNPTSLSETSNTPFEDPPTIVPPPSLSTVPPLFPSSTVPPPSPSIVPPPSMCESGSEGDTNEDTEVDSDVHQEYIEIRASKRHFKRSQIRSRGTTSDQINVDKKGPNIGYDETNIGIRESLVGKLGGDEPYYLSNEAPSFEIDDETGWGDGEEDIIRKELDIYVGRTIVRRVRTRVLQEIMGDHIVEYGQLLVAVCRDGNNQILPIALAVVAVDNQFTWTWFLKLLRNDLDLGEGHQLFIITDMQKGLEIGVQEVLPLVEHRKCARHFLANWCKS